MIAEKLYTRVPLHNSETRECDAKARLKNFGTQRTAVSCSSLNFLNYFHLYYNRNFTTYFVLYTFTYVNCQRSFYIYTQVLLNYWFETSWKVNKTENCLVSWLSVTQPLTNQIRDLSLERSTLDYATLEKPHFQFVWKKKENKFFTLASINIKKKTYFFSITLPFFGLLNVRNVLFFRQFFDIIYKRYL